MSARFVMSLTVVVAAVMGARLLFAVLPVARFARRVSVFDSLLTVGGVLLLAFHCVAMFFPEMVEAVPGVGGAASDIRALGTASIVWYVVPAVLVLVGLRRQHPFGQAAVALALTAVGVTMYNDGPFQTHLAAIFVSGLVLAGVAATLVLPPWQRGSDQQLAQSRR